MPAPRGKLTNPPELAAYVLAHAAGLVWGFVANPLIIRRLLAQGYGEHLLLAGLAISIAASLIVLLIFLLLRKAMAGSGAAPPPADAPAPPAKFTDGPELAAYVLAHAAGLIWGVTVNPMIFRNLIAQGFRNLIVPGVALSLSVSIAVLLIFLLLRKAMAGTSASG